MRIFIERNSRFIFVLLCLTIISCEGDVYEDITSKYYEYNNDFPETLDFFSIQEIRITNADKRYFNRFEHSEIKLHLTVLISNNKQKKQTVILKDTKEAKFYFRGQYKNDTIPFVCDPWDIDYIELQPEQHYEVEISTTYGIGITFWFEPLFGLKEDYREDMLRLITETKFSYELFGANENSSILIKPNKDIKIRTIDYRDSFLVRWWKKLRGKEYSYIEDEKTN